MALAAARRLALGRAAAAFTLRLAGALDFPVAALLVLLAALDCAVLPDFDLRLAFDLAAVLALAAVPVLLVFLLGLLFTVALLAGLFAEATALWRLGVSMRAYAAADLPVAAPAGDAVAAAYSSS